MKKKGISAVVATVLLILIVVVAVTIIWLAIIPMISEDFMGEASILNMRLTILINKGYTVYDEAEHFAFVHISRGTDDVTIEALEIIFNFEGNSVIYRTMNTPKPNSLSVYAFNFTRDGVVGIPRTVSVAPIYLKRNKMKTGSILDEVKMPIKPAKITLEDNYNSMGNVVDPGRGNEIPEPCFDRDGDGYGNPGSTGCSYPELDCNDRESLINPGMLERCGNCISDNCNTDVDFDDSQCGGDRLVMFEDNLVSHWKFDGNGLDELGNNNATVYGGSNISYVNGIMCGGQAIDFGAGGYAIVDNSSDDCDLNMNDDEGTISVWFKRRDYQTNVLIPHVNYIFSMFDWIGEGSMMSRMYIFFNESNDELGTAMGKNPSWEYNITSVPLGDWYFATMTWEADTPGDINGIYSIYLDGQKVNDFSYTNFTGVSQRLIWGTWRDNLACNNRGASDDEFEEYFDGQLDEGKIYNKSLNDAEVMELYMWY